MLTTPSKSSAFGDLSLSDDAPPATAASQGELPNMLGIVSSPGGFKSEPSDSLRVDSVSFGKSATLISSPEELCCATVGTSDTKFCCLPTNECKVVSHRPSGKKIIVKPGLYIVDTKSTSKGVCFIEPKLEVENIKSSLVRELMDSSLDLVELRNEFALAASQEGTTDDQVEVIERSNIEKFNTFKTPVKSKGVTFGDSLVDATSSLFELSSYTDITDVKPYNDLDQVAEGLMDLESTVSAIKRMIPNISGSVDSLSSESKQNSILTMGSVQQLKQLKLAIGSQTTLLKSLGFEPSLWGAISSLVDKTIIMEQSIATPSSDAITSAVQSSETKVKLALQDALAQLETSIHSKHTKSQDELQQSLLDLLKGWKSSIQTMQGRIGSLESSFGRTTSSSGGGFGNLGLGSNPTILPGTTIPTQDNATVLNNLTSRVESLESHKTNQSKDSLKGAVQFGGFTFTGQDDVSSWWDKYFSNPGSVPSYGLFADPQLLLHWCWIVLSGASANSARDMRDRAAVDLSLDKSYCVESFQQFVPIVFTGKKAGTLLNTNGVSKSRLAQIPDFKSWDNNDETGLRQQLAESLGFVKDSFTDLIEEQFQDSPELRAFAFVMLHTSASFIENLSSYITETYQSFRDVVGDGKSVWSLITFVVEHIFRRDFGQVRANTIGAIDPGNRASGLRMMWSAIRCVSIATDFIKHGIKNAPAVSASYVRFVIKHSNMGKVTTLMEENASLKRKLSDLTTVVNEVKRTADLAKKSSDQAISRISSLKGAANKKQKGGGIPVATVRGSELPVGTVTLMFSVGKTTPEH